MLTTGEKKNLLLLYEPVLKFHKGENFHPIPVKPYLRDCRLKRKGRFGRDEDITAQWIEPGERTPEILAAASGKLRDFGNDCYLQFVQPEQWSAVSWSYLVLVPAFLLFSWLVTGWSWHVCVTVLVVFVALWYAKTTPGVNRYTFIQFAIYALTIGWLRLSDAGILSVSALWMAMITIVTFVLVGVMATNLLGDLLVASLKDVEDRAARKRELRRMWITSRFTFSTLSAVMMISLAVQRPLDIHLGAISINLLLWPALGFLLFDLLSLPGFVMSLVSGLPPDAVVQARRQFISIRQRLSRQSDKIYHCYGRYVEDGDYVVLQYFFLYAFNDWRTAANGLNQHEADWEMAAIFLDKEAIAGFDFGRDSPPDPAFVALSQHELGDYCPWQDVEAKETHPIIYVAKGSHANYFTFGRKSILAEQLGAMSSGKQLARALQKAQEQPWILMERVTKLWTQFGLGEPSAPHGGSAVAYEVSMNTDVGLTELAEGNGMVLGAICKEAKRQLQLHVLEDDRLPGWVEYRGFWGRTSIPGEAGPPGPKWDGKNAERMRWQRPVAWLKKLQEKHVVEQPVLR